MAAVRHVTCWVTPVGNALFEFILQCVSRYTATRLVSFTFISLTCLFCCVWFVQWVVACGERLHWNLLINQLVISCTGITKVCYVIYSVIILCESFTENGILHPHFQRMVLGLVANGIGRVIGITLKPPALSPLLLSILNLITATHCTITFHSLR